MREERDALQTQVNCLMLTTTVAPATPVSPDFLKWQDSAQVGGTHYEMAIQPVTFIEANKLPFSEGNVIKYVSRHHTLPKEKAVSSLKKAVNYIQRILKARYGVE